MESSVLSDRAKKMLRECMRGEKKTLLGFTRPSRRVGREYAVEMRRRYSYGLYGRMLVPKGSAAERVFAIDDLVGVIEGFLRHAEAIEDDVCRDILARSVDNGVLPRDRCGPLDIFWWRAFEGNLIEFQRLVRKKKLDREGLMREGYLDAAILGGSMEMIRYLVGEGVDVNGKIQNGRGIPAPPLNFAAAWGSSEDVLEFLLNSGAELEGVDETGKTAALCACYEGKARCLQFLLGRGAVVNTQAHQGLLLAAQGGSDECIQVLLEHGVRVEDVQCREGETLLMVAAAGGASGFLRPLVRDYRIDVHATNREGKTALILAASAGQADCVRELLAVGAGAKFRRLLSRDTVGINTKANYGETALFHAVVGGHVECVKILLRSGANVNVQNVDGNTPAHAAAQWNRVHILELLLLGGANLQLKNWIEDTPLLSAVSRRGRSDCISMLIKHGANINQASGGGTTALMILAARGNTEYIQFLLEKGANVNAVDVHNQSALTKAARLGNSDSVRLLLEAGANPNQIDDSGKSVLFYACENANIRFDRESITLLLHHGASVDDSGRSFAEENSDKDWAKLILEM